MGRTRYGHSPTSWAKLWTRVLGDEVRVRVDTEFPRVEQVRDWKGWVWNPGRGTDMMWWSVWVLPWLLDQLAGCQSHGGLEPLRSNCKDSASLARSESPTSSVRSSTTRRFMRSASSSSTVETLPNISPYYGLVHIDHEICASAVPSQSECQHGSPSTSSVARLKTRHPLLDHLHLQPCS
ncbi:hypothetical protein OG21DRAFT_1325883 [Imleria badia]|nr:hypothetical protein OG21DRAFT_1325883 [Imleria badia]